MKKQSTQAQCASAIRKELKNIYPATKFSVTSESFSMGNAVRVSWNDGATLETIRDLLNKYQDGDFDGMTDSYDYRRENGLPRAKYVSLTRHISEQYYLEAFAHVQKQYKHFDTVANLDETSHLINDYWMCWTARNFIYRRLCKMDLTNGLDLTIFDKVY